MTSKLCLVVYSNFLYSTHQIKIKECFLSFLDGTPLKSSTRKWECSLKMLLLVPGFLLIMQGINCIKWTACSRSLFFHRNEAKIPLPCCQVFSWSLCWSWRLSLSRVCAVGMREEVTALLATAPSLVDMIRRIQSHSQVLFIASVQRVSVVVTGDI